jgi:hypothetical protein
MSSEELILKAWIVTISRDWLRLAIQRQLLIQLPRHTARLIGQCMRAEVASSLEPQGGRKLENASISRLDVI